MGKYLPAVCFHPTTVLFIDDNRKFLESTIPLMHKEKSFYNSFYNPKDALDFLTHDYQWSPFTNRCIIRPNEEEMIEHRTIDLDVRAIHREIQNPKRFAEISTIVVDYKMPGLFGLELCELLKDLPFKKILLTSELSESLAIEAFNAGIIDQFIRKDNPTFASTVNEALQDLQKIYFQNLSQIVVDCLTNSSETKAEFLLDPIFINFFEEMMNKLNATEYYLMDSQGSFMFLDNMGKPKWLAVKDEVEMQNLLNFAQIEDAPPGIITALSERTHLPYFHTDDELQTPPHNWERFLYPAEKLQGKITYYYALIDDPTAYPIPKDIVSFSQYRKTMSK